MTLKAKATSTTSSAHGSSQARTRFRYQEKDTTSKLTLLPCLVEIQHILHINLLLLRPRGLWITLGPKRGR